MMVGGGGILLMVLIFICIVVIIKRLCISPRIHSYGFIETQDVQMEPMEQSNPYSNPEQEDEYINTANRLSVDEFILGVQHKKLNYGFRREFKVFTFLFIRVSSFYVMHIDILFIYFNFRKYRTL